MIRIIPPNTKQKAKVFKNITWIDLAFYSFFFLISFIVLLIKMAIIAKLISFAVINLIGIMLIISYGQIKPYKLYFDMMLYAFRNKKNDKINLDDIDINFFENHFKYGDDWISIIKLDGIDFALYGEEKQDQIIYQLEKVFQKIPNGKIIKLDIPINFTKLIDTQNNRIKTLDKEKKLIKILENQNEYLKYFHDSKEATKPSFFLLIFDKQENNLNESIEFSINYLEQLGLNPQRLSSTEINEFLKYYFNEQKVLSIPNFKEGVSKITFEDDLEKCMISISQLGVFSSNAWLYEIFHMSNIKITMNFRIIQDKAKVLRSIDKSLIELEAQYSNPKNTQSQKTDLDYKIESLKNLIEDLKIGSQELHEFQLYVMCDKDEVKKVLETFKNCGVYSSKLLFKQKIAYYDSLPFLRGFNQKESIFNITTAGLAGTFPFISTFFMDTEGIYMGSNEHMIFFDLFKNLRFNKSSKLTRTNANMAILGKSGGGKSYFCKKLLLNERLDNCKIFILDPEDEYRKLAKSVDGNWIDIGGVSSGMINPFQVFPSLAQSDEERSDIETNTFVDHLSQHRQFLESFFQVVIPEIDYETITLLNKNIKQLYANFNIFETTDVEKLNATDFPTFEDLAKLVEKNAKSHNETYFENLYRKLGLILEDFRKGGLNSKLWNGHTTLKTDNKFTVLNFQSLFANNNNRVANGQMLVVMRYLMQEIIKNKNLNNLNKDNLSKIIIQIDEAHQFIDPDFPVALKFMYQMIKRIRKYAGSMIVATQNIKDFIGRSEATRTQASAILNGCQYAMIFGLGADDLNSTVELYRSYNNGLTKAEQDFIANASQGEALLLVDSNKRNTFKVELYPGEEQLIM